jgi:hypothetical protein
MKSWLKRLPKRIPEEMKLVAHPLFRIPKRPAYSNKRGVLPPINMPFQLEVFIYKYKLAVLK